MTDAQQREAARQFFYRWNGKGREDEDARSYWIEILSNIIGVERVTERVDFEKKSSARTETLRELMPISVKLTPSSSRNHWVSPWTSHRQVTMA